MKCIHCQKELPNGALFCKYCGKKQEGASVTQEKVFSDFPNHIDHQTSGDALNTKEPSPTPVLQEISSSGNAESQVFDLNEAMQELSSHSGGISPEKENGEQELENPQFSIFEAVESHSDREESTGASLEKDASDQETLKDKQNLSGKKRPFVIQSPELQVAEAVSAQDIHSTKWNGILAVLWRVAVLGIEIGAIVWLWNELFF
ncbi:MAG: hypothetical protein ACLRS7_12230 [Acutalibacter sp.]